MFKAAHFIPHVVLYRDSLFFDTLIFLANSFQDLFSPSPRVRLGTRPQGNGVSYFLNLDFVLVFIG